MRKTLIVAVLLGILAAACGVEDEPPESQGPGAQNEPACDVSDPPLFEPGVLTVATDRPAFPPWFEGSPKNYSGFEGDLANEIADRMNLRIKWVVEPFNRSYAPGDKEYDFDINEITITTERERAVDFSEGYFNNNQGILALEGSAVEDAATVGDLKEFRLGTQVGTTSLDFINEVIQPTSEPRVFDTTNDVKSALESEQIDALVTDVVTTVFMRDFEIEGSVVIGQYPSEEQFGILFENENPLRICVNEVLAEIKSDGTLDGLQEQWLQQYLSVPTLQD